VAKQLLDTQVLTVSEDYGIFESWEGERGFTQKEPTYESSQEITIEVKTFESPSIIKYEPKIIENSAFVDILKKSFVEKTPIFESSPRFLFSPMSVERFTHSIGNLSNWMIFSRGIFEMPSESREEDMFLPSIGSSLTSELENLPKWIRYTIETPKIQSTKRNLLEKFISLSKTKPKSSKKEGMDETLSKIEEKFNLLNRDELTKFVMKTSVNVINDFHLKLGAISEQAYDFIKNEGIDISGSIEAFKDAEIDNFESISITFLAKNIDSDRCLELTDKLITKIAETEPDVLKYIQIEIIPDVNN